MLTVLGVTQKKRIKSRTQVVDSFSFHDEHANTDLSNLSAILEIQEELRTYSPKFKASRGFNCSWVIFQSFNLV